MAPDSCVASFPVQTADQPMSEITPTPIHGMGKPRHSPQGWRPEGISHVLLDIEGTTCPVSFVAGSLFPYASQQLGDYLRAHGREPMVRELLEAVVLSWMEDPSEEARSLLKAHHGADGVGPDQLQALETYLRLLIRADRKLTALKDLQGMIWRQGYEDGHLKAPLFADVPEALRRWSDQGLILAVYSSGSVAAQQLLYGHSSGGDLRSLFRHWFDTRVGAKKDPESYCSLAKVMEIGRAHV